MGTFFKWFSFTMIIISVIMAFLLIYAASWLSATIWIFLAGVWYLNYKSNARFVEARRQLNQRIEEMIRDKSN